MPKRVLVADDDQRLRESLRGYFESLDCTVDTASNYHGVRELIDKHAYNLIVCDNSMPLGNDKTAHPTCGLELLAHAKLHGPNMHAPFVIHTADDSNETKYTVEEELGGIYLLKATPGFLAFLKKLL